MKRISIRAPNITPLDQKELILAFLVSILCFVLLTNVAFAHADLIESSPKEGEVLERPPDQVVVRFSSELAAQDSTLRVYDSHENQVDRGDGGVDLNDLDHTSMLVTLPPLLSSGSYMVHWVALSAEDGDLTEGTFGFAIGQPEVGSELSSPSTAYQPPWLIGMVIGIGLVSVILVSLYIWKSRQVRRDD